jgi:flagellar protein FlbB
MNDLQKDEGTEKKHSKIQWFLFVVFIPLLFAVSVALLILTVSGVNVFEEGKKYGQKIPFVSQFIPGTEENTMKQLQEEIVQLKATIVEKDEEIKQVNQSLEEKQKEIDALKQEIARLNAEKEQQGNTKSETAEQQATNQAESTQQTMRDIIKMYETMSPRKAAEIIPQMSDQEAVDLLSRLKSDKAAAILEKMDSANAAKYTSLLAKNAANTP